MLLPEGQQTVEDVREAVKTVQFRTSVGQLNQALHSEQLDSLLQSLQVPTSRSTNPDEERIETLINALDSAHSTHNPFANHTIRSQPDGERDEQAHPKASKKDEKEDQKMSDDDSH
eukprot:GHVP01041585.1.p2 GENE.GHVP01041585.1~~GHVP01041585.1.p2  ORF type:complete len:116 (-),score=21.83 GHVP01041585.1:699-1046(-)